MLRRNRLPAYLAVAAAVTDHFAAALYDQLVDDRGDPLITEHKAREIAAYQVADAVTAGWAINPRPAPTSCSHCTAKEPTR